jgi:NAD(P)-dependent dehydrogenase (short-subunit alcohol dehydrogenase family)
MRAADVTAGGDFRTPYDAVVIGATGGLGSAFVAALTRDPGVATVLALSRSGGEGSDGKRQRGRIDLLDDDSIAAAATRAKALPTLRLVIVATGFLHGAGDRPERSFRDLDAPALSRSFAINTIGPAMVLKHFLPLLPRQGKSVFAALSARVGSISDNRLGGWYGYRAAKAGLNQLLRTASIELGRSHPEAIILGLHPGTVATPLSEPFIASYTANPVFTPEDAAGRLLDVIARADAAWTGTVRDWQGLPVPP